MNILPILSFFEKNVIATSIYPEISKISIRIDFMDLKTLLPKIFNVYYEVFIWTIKFQKIVFIILKVSYKSINRKKCKSAPFTEVKSPFFTCTIFNQRTNFKELIPLEKLL